MKLGTQIRLPDGRVGTVVYNSLDGVGIKWGLHSPPPSDFEGSNGSHPPAEFKWYPDAMLRTPCKFETLPCVGNEFEIIREGYDF